jgi:Putative GTP-binding controlling metal-binding
VVAAGSPAAAVARLRGAGKQVVASASLSDRGDPEQAARVLFSTLRELDRSGADAIVAEPWPDPVGLGRAVQDRLTRASAR